MQHIRLAPEKEIELIAKAGSTIKEALEEAKFLVIKHQLSGALLFCFGFTILVEADSNLEELAEEFKNWKEFKDNQPKPNTNQTPSV